MRYAETGVDLEIDLSRGSIEKVATDPRLTELYLGGEGTNAKTLWDRVPPEVEPFSPDNLLIFAAGLLCGTPVPGANRTIVSTISPQTLLHAHSMMGGFWAPELKHAGYDRVIIRGKSPSLVYLWIHNDKVEIRDATHLQGKGCLEAANLIREELKEDEAQVASIGLAGENRVYFASIEHAKSSASRAGIGAIMGDKRLKAIAVRGTKDINVAQPAELWKLCDDMMKQWTGKILERGSLGIQFMAMKDDSHHTNFFSWGNARHRRKDYWNKEIEEQWVAAVQENKERMISCYNCPHRCGALINNPEHPRYMIKCYSKFIYPMAAMTDDLGFAFRFDGFAQEYGIDCYTGSQVLAFAIELYEAGILTDQDMAGMPCDTEGRFFWLLHRIARREGIGDVLANGTHWAGLQIGKGAEAFAHNNVKKLEQVAIKLGAFNPIYYLMYCTNEKMTITQIEGSWPQAPLPTKEMREEFVKNWVQAPDEKFKQYFLDWEPRGNPSVQACCEIVDWNEMMHYVDDALGFCAFWSSFAEQLATLDTVAEDERLQDFAPYHINNIPDFLSLATGMDIDKDKLWEIATRNRNLVRAINIRRGMRRADEVPPEDHWRQRLPEYEKELLDTYYKLKGWNNDGVMTKETLQKLGLDYISEDFEQRGIYDEYEEEQSTEVKRDALESEKAEA